MSSPIEKNSEKSTIYLQCSGKLDFFNLHNKDANHNKINIRQIRASTIIHDKAYDQNKLLFKKALLIKLNELSQEKLVFLEFYNMLNQNPWSKTLAI